MGRQVIHDHDVAGRELRRQDVGDVGREGLAVHRSVEDPSGDHAGSTQAGHEGGGLPVAVRHAGAQPLAARGSAIAARHVGRGPGLVDEDELVRIEIELPLEPLLAPLQDVGAVLLGRVRRLFLRVISRRLKNRHTVPIATWAPCSASSVCNSARVMSGVAS